MTITDAGRTHPMTAGHDLSRAALLGPARLTHRDVVASAAGVAVGVTGAAFYYSDAFRPLAHTFQLWVLLIGIVAAHQPLMRGALQGGIALLASVVSFYVGKAVIYHQLYPGTTYYFDGAELAQWSALGLVGGAALGTIASRIGGKGWLAALATSVFIATLIVDGINRYRNYDEALVLWAAAAGTALLLTGFVRTKPQIIKTAAMTVPATACAAGILYAAEVISK